VSSAHLHLQEVADLDGPELQDLAELANASPDASWPLVPHPRLLGCGASLEDEIQGHNHHHALAHAHWNWPHASPIQIRPMR
jgi:hypothetical protein